MLAEMMHFKVLSFFTLVNLSKNTIFVLLHKLFFDKKIIIFPNIKTKLLIYAYI